MSKRFERSKLLNIGRNLPPSFHKLPGEKYDVRKSEVLDWLMKRPSIREYIWTKFRNSNDIEYDPDTGKWQGVDYEVE